MCKSPCWWLIEQWRYCSTLSFIFSIYLSNCRWWADDRWNSTFNSWDWAFPPKMCHEFRSLWEKSAFQLQVQIENVDKKFDKITIVLNQPKDDAQIQVTAAKQIYSWTDWNLIYCWWIWKRRSLIWNLLGLLEKAKGGMDSKDLKSWQNWW